ncbi:hypothetical protein KEM52_005048 [Ascosphaera acerosa]|nr:hypothetical protein KEM52_005048 [Ascosphaera acerosa]
MPPSSEKGTRTRTSAGHGGPQYERPRQRRTSELPEEIQEIIKSYGPNSGATGRLVKGGFQATMLVLCVAVCNPVSQLALTPVYGSVLSRRFYLLGLRIAMLLGWASRKRMPSLLPASIGYFLPVLAGAIPLVQLLLFQQSEALGPDLGPVLTYLNTDWLLAFAASSALAQIMEIDGLCTGTMGFVASYFSYHNLSVSAETFVEQFIGSSVAVTRVPMQMAIAAALGVAYPSRWLLLLLPSLLMTATYDIHAPFVATTERLSSTLASQGYQLLARTESQTGYLSVLESKEGNFRVLRCDHSLLGGEWTNLRNAEYPAIKDPIFPVFTMLEAVRLVRTGPTGGAIPQKQDDALIIGLGIGSTPAALAAHGVNTTAVELDPAVVDLASTHFHVPEQNLGIVVEDALNPHRYKYIIHDVFTGGVEPTALFTKEFLQQLHDLLRDDGAIAINYAADLTKPPVGLVIRTILSVFPSCRIYRDGDHQSGPADLANLVAYCKRESSPLELRAPKEADYLGSASRRSYLMPVHEIDATAFAWSGEGPELVAEENTQDLGIWHPHMAAEHWRQMRTVLPAEIWEAW